MLLKRSRSNMMRAVGWRAKRARFNSRLPASKNPRRLATPVNGSVKEAPPIACGNPILGEASEQICCAHADKCAFEDCKGQQIDVRRIGMGQCPGKRNVDWNGGS